MLIRELALERGYNAASIGKCVYADVANAEIKPDFSSERGNRRLDRSLVVPALEKIPK